MPNPRLAGRYAKSIIDLATERNQLEEVYKDMQYLQTIAKSSREFVNVLQSPIIKSDKKQAILNALTDGKVSQLVSTFLKLLVSKGRESDLPEIVNAFIDQYNSIKGIYKVKLITAIPISEELRSAIVAKANKEADLKTVALETKVNENIIGGFILEFDNNLVDASILRDLKDIKKQFDDNAYIRKIR